MTTKHACYLLLFAILIAVSAAVTYTGHAGGLAGLLLFGVGALVYVRVRLVPHPKSAVGHGPVRAARRYTTATVGIVFHPRPPAGLSGVLGYPFLGVAAAAVLSSPVIADGDPTTWDRGDLGLDPPPVIEMGYWAIVGGITVLLALAFGTDLARSLVRRAQGIAVLPEGVYLRTPAGAAWLPWDQLAGVWIVEHPRRPVIAVAADTRGGIELGGVDRLFRGWRRRRFGADITCAGRRFRNPPEVVTAIHHYWSTPSARDRLVEPTEAGAIRRRCGTENASSRPLGNAR